MAKNMIFAALLGLVSALAGRQPAFRATTRESAEHLKDGLQPLSDGIRFRHAH